MSAGWSVTITPEPGAVETPTLKMWRPEDPVSRTTGTGFEFPTFTSTIGCRPPTPLVPGTTSSGTTLPPSGGTESTVAVEGGAATVVEEESIAPVVLAFASDEPQAA